jgi:hypothetical protein
LEDILSAWLDASSQRDFVLIIADRISGVTQDKGTHRPISYQLDGVKLIIAFDDEASLTLFSPSEISIGSIGELIVRDASEARFAWHYPRQPGNAPKLCEEVFRKAGRAVEFSRTGAPFVTSGMLLYQGDKFVIIRPAFQPPKTRST